MRKFLVICSICRKEFTTSLFSKLLCSKKCENDIVIWKDFYYTSRELERTKQLKELDNEAKRRNVSKASLRPDYPKWKARKAVELALRYGRMVRPSICPLCLNKLKVEAHHSDYSQPLLIEWACRKCHQNLHSGYFKSLPVVPS